MFPIEAFESTLIKIGEILDRLSVGYHMTGGITTIAYGEPRMTQDLDLVIDPAAISARLDDFLQTLSDSDFLFDDAAIRYAVENRRVFQLLDTVETLKLDIYPRELIPGELSRSVKTDVFEHRQFPIASRADAAVSKLIWVSKGSHKSRQDLRKIFQACNADEQDLIRNFSTELQLTSLLEELLAESDEPIE